MILLGLSLLPTYTVIFLPCNSYCALYTPIARLSPYSPLSYFSTGLNFITTFSTSVKSFKDFSSPSKLINVSGLTVELAVISIEFSSVYLPFT